MTAKWFFSKAVRRATELGQHVQEALNSQRDILNEKAAGQIAGGLGQFRTSLAAAANSDAVREAMTQLEEVAVKWLKPYPFASTRENIKEFLVSGVLILTVFNFFIQPMKIPSGSAQPTLYGNVVYNLKDAPEVAIPGTWGRVLDWFKGIDYHRWVANDDGKLGVEAEQTTAGFIKTQRFHVGQDTYTFWWPPENLKASCGAAEGQDFRKGDTILRLKITSGDRLFVDRFTYNFRRPERGETIVFTSTGIPGLIQNTHYIKRLIGLPEDNVRIGDDRHVIINGQRLDYRTRHFEFVYSFTGPPMESVYSGHVNQKIGEFYKRPIPAPNFPDGNAEFLVRPHHYLAFGDNTMNSFDGRAWGDFPEHKVVGKALFVFWPFTSRFGFVCW